MIRLLAASGPDAVDSVRFEALAAEAKGLLVAGQAADASDALQRALRLWRGQPYEDVAFQSFAQPEIRRLEELRAAVAEDLVAAMLGAGRDAEAALEAERLVTADALRERRWELLTFALYRAGRQGDALRALERARRTLADELGVAPGPELRRLEQDILAQAPALETQSEGDERRGAARRVSLLEATGLMPRGPASGAGEGGGAVLHPSARPHGYSLADMAALVVPFTMRGYDPQRRPETPLQILYAENVVYRRVGTGVLATGTKTFTAAATTHFYVPIFIEQDEPPVVGVFPTTPEEAVPYVFHAALCGARNFEVVIDGSGTPIGPEYVVGPLARSDDESVHFVVLAAFLAPLRPGSHTVNVSGGCFGAGLAKAYGTAFLQEDFGYTVEVSED